MGETVKREAEYTSYHSRFDDEARSLKGEKCEDGEKCDGEMGKGTNEYEYDEIEEAEGEESGQEDDQEEGEMRSLNISKKPRTQRESRIY